MFSTAVPPVQSRDFASLQFKAELKKLANWINAQEFLECLECFIRVPLHQNGGGSDDRPHYKHK